MAVATLSESNFRPFVGLDGFITRRHQRPLAVGVVTVPPASSAEVPRPPGEARRADYSAPPPRSRNTPIEPHSSGRAASWTIHTRDTVSFPTAVNVGVSWANQLKRK